MELTGALPPMAGRGAAELGTGSGGGGQGGSGGGGGGGGSSLNPGHNAQYLDKLQVGEGLRATMSSARGARAIDGRE